MRADDLPALRALAAGAGAGLTSLPADADYLAGRIESARATPPRCRVPADMHLMLVLEDSAGGAVVGTSAVEGAVGLDQPWYNYRVGTAVYWSRTVGIFRRLQTLFLTNDLTGTAELCSLYLHPDFRREGNGSLLSKSRFLFMAEFPEAFDPRVIAEMRGVSDDDGRSPFWDSLGRHFFRMGFTEADYLTGVGSKAFIAQLMPHHPLYTAFLSEQAEAVIGQVHPHTRPALAMLEAEGFRYQGYVDIFDGGPTVECPLGSIRAVRDSRVLEAVHQRGGAKGRPWLVSNRRWEGYRACLAVTAPEGETLPLTTAQRALLELETGDSVRAVPLSPKEPKT